MFLVFDWWLDVIWLKSHRNATYCIDFNIVIRILNTPVSAKMAQGQRKWRAVIYIYVYIYIHVVSTNIIAFDGAKSSAGISQTIYFCRAAIANDQILVASFQMIVKILLNGEIPLTSRIEPAKHYSDVIISTVASQNTSLAIVYSTFHSDADHKKKSKLRITGLCAGNSPVTSEFLAQMANNAENVSIWWRHLGNLLNYGPYEPITKHTET